MKTVKLLLLAFILVVSAQSYAQTADEIIAKYFENSGGIANWKSIEGMKMIAKINQGGMVIPLEIIQLKSGKQMTVINFQGKTIKQGVFDGEVLWSTNFMTQKAEKGDQETTDNMKLQKNDFPDPFLNYRMKGYQAEFLGKETIDGVETFKIKLTKNPILVDGVKEENVSYYFFDAENYVPLIVQSEIKSGPMKGQVSEAKFSDYQEVGGVYFPYSLTQGLKGQAGQTIAIDKIELNPQIDPKEFSFPEEVSNPQENK
ncbi:MAG TPA: outer membrane lipoprotein-sorting protein [Bacteroidales bacterium]|nr:outer membrane lipoprotein-sorting protein [Bacteroidales bacterium]